MHHHLPHCYNSRYVVAILLVFLTICAVWLRVQTVSMTPTSSSDVNVVDQRPSQHHEQNHPQHGAYKSEEKATTAPFQDKILAFLRIPKTGSTSFIQFLRLFSGLQPYRSAFSNDQWDTKFTTNDRFRLGCMYRKVVGSNTTVETTSDNPCAHVTFQVITSAYNHSLSVLRDNNAVIPPNMQVVTIVREPFDYLRSYFYFCHKLSKEQWGRDQFSDEMYELVVSGDFSTWLELFPQKKPRERSEYQYEWLHENVEEAIQMMENSTVLVLITECLEASLRLLQQSFDGIKPDAVTSFVQSSDFHSRVSSKLYKDNEEDTKLRTNSKVWFADDYRFYNAARAHFQQHLSRYPTLRQYSQNCSVLFDRQLRK